MTSCKIDSPMRPNGCGVERSRLESKSTAVEGERACRRASLDVTSVALNCKNSSISDDIRRREVPVVLVFTGSDTGAAAPERSDPAPVGGRQRATAEAQILSDLIEARKR